MAEQADCKKNNVHILILAGGSGTRLWPLSTEERPKQFLSLCGHELSLLQLTVKRMLGVADKSNLHIVSRNKWKHLFEEQLSIFDFDRYPVIEEPEGRNTAPAIALGIAHLRHEGANENDVVIVCPSDHLIKDEGAFFAAIDVAIRAARAGNIVTLGIKPTKPETGFGYIKAGDNSQGEWFEVDAFVEKPDKETAIGYLESGNYYWNGGIFCFRITDILEAFRSFSASCHKIVTANRQSLMDEFLQAGKISIDYEVMEKAENIVCVPMNAGWSDVGSWEAVYEYSRKDAFGNVLEGNVTHGNCHNNMIIAGGGVIMENIESTIIVRNNGSLLIR